MPYLGLGAEISLVGYVLKTPPVGILDVPKKKSLRAGGAHSTRVQNIRVTFLKNGVHIWIFVR